MLVNTLFFKRDDVATQLNLILNYEQQNLCKKFVSGNIQKLFKGVVFLLGSGFPIAAPIAIGLINVMELYMPPFIGSVLPEIRIDGWENIGEIVLISGGHFVAILVQAWMVYIISSTVMMLIFHILVGLGKKEGSRLFLKSIILHQLRHFRQLKIIEAQINFTMSTTFLPSVLVSFCFANIMSTFLSVLYIRRGLLFHNLGHFIFLHISWQTYFGIMCFGTLPGLLNKNSIKYLGSFGRREFKSENLGVAFKKDVKACGQMRIKFGSNFWHNNVTKLSYIAINNGTFIQAPDAGSHHLLSLHSPELRSELGGYRVKTSKYPDIYSYPGQNLALQPPPSNIHPKISPSNLHPPISILNSRPPTSNIHGGPTCYVPALQPPNLHYPGQNLALQPPPSNIHPKFSPSNLHPPISGPKSRPPTSTLQYPGQNLALQPPPSNIHPEFSPSNLHPPTSMKKSRPPTSKPPISTISAELCLRLPTSTSHDTLADCSPHHRHHHDNYESRRCCSLPQNRASQPQHGIPIRTASQRTQT
ncbi:Disintegrin and metalloproteinase domain-containing protein 29 [Folsomia candida]|uniref:Disintegrin and metalloproteinase domain-containing protein 29 n=1 Tax=Folsomia candida TaxID=158441 RepID=A0A226D218_FOLCA|nr:Disintegrin and metalloproteinase domain-containing protein 29 [Folsomia candida]